MVLLLAIFEIFVTLLANTVKQCQTRLGFCLVLFWQPESRQNIPKVFLFFILKRCSSFSPNYVTLKKFSSNKQLHFWIEPQLLVRVTGLHLRPPSFSKFCLTICFFHLVRDETSLYSLLFFPPDKQLYSPPPRTKTHTHLIPSLSRRLCFCQWFQGASKQSRAPWKEIRGGSSVFRRWQIRCTLYFLRSFSPSLFFLSFQASFSVPFNVPT